MKSAYIAAWISFIAAICTLIAAIVVLVVILTREAQSAEISTSTAVEHLLRGSTAQKWSVVSYVVGYVDAAHDAGRCRGTDRRALRLFVYDKLQAIVAEQPDVARIEFPRAVRLIVGTHTACAHG